MMFGCTSYIDVSSVEEFDQIAKSQGYRFTARAQPISWITADGLVEYGSSQPAQGAHNTQYEANQIAMNICRSRFQNCIIIRESGVITEAAKNVIAKLKKAQEKTKVAKKTKKKKSASTSKSSEGSSGSGFFINNKGYVITNYHVVEGCRSTPKIMYDDNPVEAKLVAKDKYLDLALLKTNLRNTTYIPLSKNPPRKLQRIVAAGYPFGKYVSDDMKFTSGIVSSLKGIGDDSTRLQIDAALNPGNSGGPIIDEETGELVAVAVAGLRKDKTEAVNFGIKTVSVKNFLESNQINTRTFTKKYNRENIASLLEKATLYVFCK